MERCGLQPYYEHAGITIYHGDCRDVLEEWEGLRTQSFDLLLTDPPYGIGVARVHRIGAVKKVQTKGWRRVPDSPEFPISDWDDEPVHDAIPRLRTICRAQIIFGGNYYHLPPSRCWLVWDKDNTGNFADCELAWTNLDQAVRMFTYRWNGMLQEPGCPREYRQHPTQKPEPVIRWALMQVPKARTVLDPFMGSGTTLVAAKRLGKQATGIEREERYCEIASQRLQQEALDFGT